MMKNVCLLISSCFVLGSCTDHANHATTPEAPIVKTAATADEKAEVIELNNGVPWAVNEEMKPFVAAGANLVDAFVHNQQKDYKMLAQQVKGENDQLIKSCTMKGKSHDELHKWLHPHLEMVKALEQATDTAQANLIVQQLQASYKNYHLYFK